MAINVVFDQLFGLAVVELPVVGYTGVFWPQLQLGGWAFAHFFKHVLEAHIAQLDQGWVVDVGTQFDACRSLVTVGAARIAINHGVVAIGKPFDAYGQEVLGFVGHIVSRIIGGLARCVHVHAEYREVTRMARPFPVVGIAPVFADAFGWSTHQAYILIHIVAVHQVLAAFKNGNNHGGFKFVTRYGGSDQALCCFIDFGQSFSAFEVARGFENFGAHIIDAA